MLPLPITNILSRVSSTKAVRVFVYLVQKSRHLHTSPLKLVTQSFLGLTDAEFPLERGPLVQIVLDQGRGYSRHTDKSTLCLVVLENEQRVLKPLGFQVVTHSTGLIVGEFHWRPGDRSFSRDVEYTGTSWWMGTYSRWCSGEILSIWELRITRDMHVNLCC